jgi:hypothetical protein
MDHHEGLLQIIFWATVVCLVWYLFLNRRILKHRQITQYVQWLKKVLPDEQFTVVAWPPFFVISNEEAEDVKIRTERTIDWAAKMLKKSFFKTEPLWTCIWLFKNQESYKTCMEKWQGKKRSLPGGFFAENSNSMVMNISLGNGIIVHEMVHAYMHANFRKCPPWFNEGMASLYNRCNEESGEIHGHPDYSLLGLQTTILNNKILSFAKLLAMSRNEFYLERFRTDNYVQSRYLCYYLQQQGLLKKFYHDFSENHRDDPTGFKTLKNVVGYDDIQRFEKDWEKFILELSTPDPD